MHMYAKLIREGRVSFEHLAEIHNRLSEDLSFRRVLRLAESVPGTALYMTMSLSSAWITPSPPDFANTWNASQISPKSIMRPVREGRMRTEGRPNLAHKNTA
jgi:hypothetical protein